MKWKALHMPKGIAKEKAETNYGRFVVEPLERGWGVTLGNALRRVLLSSLQGAAVVSVRFEGASHEFSTLEGVKEDVSEIILNLKRLRVKLRSAKEKLGDVQEVVADRAKAAARATDDFVHDNPWKSVGIAAAAGFLIGLLVNRR